MAAGGDAAFVDGILRDLERSSSEARRAHLDRHHPSAVRPLGASKEALAAALRAIRARARGRDPAAVLGLAVRIAGTARREPVHLAWSLLDRRPDAIAVASARDLRALDRGTDHWAAVDAFSVQVLGRAWAAGVIGDGDIRRRAASPDRWVRRSALVATVPLNQKTRGAGGDARRTLAICRFLIDDRDDMVVKALSWALRSLAGPDPAAVEAFLARHGDRVPARARRETRTRLRTGRKNPKPSARE
jgi:hypothetical protein